VIEYQTPKTFRKLAENDKIIWLVGPRLTAWIDRLFAACPPQHDPLWAGHPETSRHLVRAGAAFHRAMVGKALGNSAKADAEWQVFLHEWRLGAR
jgi:hypothetical protein